MVIAKNGLSETARLAAIVLLLSCAVFGQSNDADDDENYIVPVRPSVSESANIQKRGVVQIESGADFDFSSPDFRSSQTAPLGLAGAFVRNVTLSHFGLPLLPLYKTCLKSGDSSQD